MNFISDFNKLNNSILSSARDIFRRYQIDTIHLKNINTGVITAKVINGSVHKYHIDSVSLINNEIIVITDTQAKIDFHSLDIESKCLIGNLLLKFRR